MTPLSGKTIATVGSGAMAEAMIAGLLRGELVTPDQIVASHPRPERRDHLRSEYGIRVVAERGAWATVTTGESTRLRIEGAGASVAAPDRGGRTKWESRPGRLATR